MLNAEVTKQLSQKHSETGFCSLFNAHI